MSRLHRAIGSFAQKHGVDTPVVEIGLLDGSRYYLERIDPEPGMGMVTIHVMPDDDDETPDALIIPVGTIRRVELRAKPEDRVASFGFNLPPK